ncbi:hypothetical protein F4777DRAFT_554558 [Nemania sp. FL0916]|nr:hypothetical protein F4777DRAFT_554558 [Nemania sp. FL0916]
MDNLQPTLRSLLARTDKLTITATATATTLAAALAYAWHCYAQWHALGEGGVPRTPRGWLMNVAAHALARRDHRAVPAPYEKKRTRKNVADGARRGKIGDVDGESTEIVLTAREEEIYDALSRMSFLSFPLSHSDGDGIGFGFTRSSLPQRGSPRPTVPTTVFPQRQTTQTVSDAVVARQNAYIRSLAKANPQVFAIRPSKLESPKFAALWLASTLFGSEDQDQDEGKEKGSESRNVLVDAKRVRWLPPMAQGEIVHVHHEGSAHVILGLADAAAVVRAGWGERHKMSGVKDMLPWGYVLLYAPREGSKDRDWEVWKAVVLAAARTVARCAGFEGEVVVPHSWDEE